MATASPPKQEMPIPRSRPVGRAQFVIPVLVVLFVALAIVNLYHGDGVIFSYLWLGLVTLFIVRDVSEAGGLWKYLVNWLGEWFGSFYVAAESGEVRFGFRWLGRRFVQQRIPVERIESVEWSSGQATALARYDMKDWQVVVWFDHGDPKESERRARWARKPDQNLHIVGPDTPKERAEELGLSLVAFLRDAGADLIPGASTTCYVRRDRDGGPVE
jgi:hypothetical protein